MFSDVVLLISVLAWKNKKRQVEGVSVIREHGEDAWDVLFRVQSLLTKNPVTFWVNFFHRHHVRSNESLGFCKKFAVFDVRALVVPEYMWKLDTCGPLEAFLRAPSSRGGSDQGKNKSDHFPFTEKAEFPDSMIVYHTLKMRAELHIWCCFQRIHSRRIKQGVCWQRGRQNKFRHMPPDCISIPFFIKSFSSK